MRPNRILLSHGAGGKMTHELIEELFLEAFENEVLRALEDSALLTASGSRVAFTTDSYVVKPLFFSGGDIGRLSVCGTVNDLAMLGGRRRQRQGSGSSPGTRRWWSRGQRRASTSPPQGWGSCLMG